MIEMVKVESDVRQDEYDKTLTKMASEVVSTIVVEQSKVIGIDMLDLFCEKLTNIILDTIKYTINGIEALGPLTSEELDIIEKMSDEDYNNFVKDRILHK